jgi:hypothetical protein
MAEFFQLIKNVVLKPSILKHQNHIFLLSHMRANTSLLGHILGEHEEINGYYEKHIGYYSWKSLLRQKGLYFALHPKEPVKANIFDKLLHDGHEISDAILNRPNTKFLISLREPEISVKSAVSMFSKKLPDHEFTNPSIVCAYYMNRADSLVTYSQKLKNRYFYYDAEQLIENSSKTLEQISKYLGLTLPLKEKFTPKTLTGIGDGGDHTGNLLSGNIIKKSNIYEEIQLSDKQIDDLTKKYSEVRVILINNAIGHI